MHGSFNHAHASEKNAKAFFNFMQQKKGKKLTEFFPYLEKRINKNIFLLFTQIKD